MRTICEDIQMLLDNFRFSEIWVVYSSLFTCV